MTSTRTDRHDTRRTARRRRRTAARPTYRLYVIRLRNDAAQLPRVQKANPHAIDGKPVVYVGMTTKTRQARFAEHKAGGMPSSSIVRRFGRRLFPWAYPACTTYRTKAKAEVAERAHADTLRARGWFVWQN